jgi:hypothetical protein
MKKVLIFLFSSLLFLLACFSFANADFWSDLFGSNKEIPYCSWNDCWLEQWVNQVKTSGISGIITTWTASGYIQRIIAYLLTFLKLVAVIIIIYAWFNMLTAAWDEEKFKSSRKIIIFAIIWLVIIYLAWPITSFVIGIFTK